MKKIYIVGAQSVGKTTLIRGFRELVPATNGTFVIVSEVARDLIRAEGVSLAIFQDLANHQDEFYGFNMSLVRRYLQMAQSDQQAQLSDPSAKTPTKIYDRSGADAIAYICTYLPHLADRMLSEPCCSELMQLYASDPDLKLLLVPPHAEFIVQDGTRLPPCLSELENYTANLRALLARFGIAWEEISDKSLTQRVRQLAAVARVPC